MTRTEFENFAGRFGPGLRRAAYAYTGNKHDAEDLVQEVLLALAKRRAAIDARAAYTYAMTTMWRKFENRADRERKRPALERGTWYERPADGPSDTADRVILAAAMERLTLLERQVLVCLYFAGLTTRETANVMRLRSPQRVSEISVSARHRLRTLLGGTYEGLEFPGRVGGAEMGGQVDEEPA